MAWKSGHKISGEIERDGVRVPRAGGKLLPLKWAKPIGWLEKWEEKKNMENLTSKDNAFAFARFIRFFTPFKSILWFFRAVFRVFLGCFFICHASCYSYSKATICDPRVWKSFIKFRLKNKSFPGAQPQLQHRSSAGPGVNRVEKTR